MITIDNALMDLISTDFYNSQVTFPERDLRILKSLGNQIRSNKFLTENQGKLLVKIFKENQSSLKQVEWYRSDFFDNITYSKPFRVIENVKKIYIDPKNSNAFIVEFSFNKRIKATLTETINKEKINTHFINGKTTSIDFTELNLYHVIKNLKKYNFVVSDNLLLMYKEIENILLKKENYKLNFINNAPLTKKLTEEIGIESLSDTKILADNRLRYSFDIDYDYNDSLSSKIASRKKTKLWIQKEKANLNEVIHALYELKRFPILFVLESHQQQESITNLKNIHMSLSELGKTVNVYFRLDNSSGKEFNEYISFNSLNNFLTNQTDSIILDNRHLPKFLFTTNWYPRSVIAFTNNFRSNKTSSYCDMVDLCIYYTGVQPIMSDTDEIL